MKENRKYQKKDNRREKARKKNGEMGGDGGRIENK